jgi:hypothetical protein
VIRPALLFSIIASPLLGLSAATLDITTASTANWRVTAGAAVDAVPYTFGTEISVTSDGTGMGSFVQGESFANFSGFWLAKYTFSLPSDATSVSLTYSNLNADDRMVLALNGITLASTGLPHFGNDASGSMVLTEGGPLQAWSFTGPAGSVSGVVTSGFNLGGVNVLEAIMNNTDTGVYGPNLPIYAGTSNDSTTFGVFGVISYSVPEPSSLWLLLTAAGLMLRCRQRHFRNG